MRASLDGTRLGWIDATTGSLHVRDAAGQVREIEHVYQGDWRFSHDGKRVAAASRGDAQQALLVMDLDSGALTDLGTLPSSPELEWSKDGVLVSLRDGEHQLVYVPLDGARRVLASGVSLTFASAAEAKTVWFSRLEGGKYRLYRTDVDGAEPVDLGPLEGAVTNAEARADGGQAAFATMTGVHLVERNGVARVSTESGIHSLWFSPEGTRLVWASPATVTVREAKKTYTLGAVEGRFETVRFVDGGKHVLVAAGRVVLRWQPEEQASVVVAKATQREQLRAAELFGDDLVLWSSVKLGRR